MVYLQLIAGVFPLAFLLCAIRFLCEKCNYLSSDLSSLANGRWQHSLKVAVFHSDIYIVIVVGESWEPEQQPNYIPNMLWLIMT